MNILDRGHYVRFDFSTATKLLDISQRLIARYGSITHLLEQSHDLKDLARRLQDFKGIGPVTTRMFLRDLKFPSTSSSRPGLAQRHKMQ